MIHAALSYALLLCLQAACTENLCLYTHVEIVVPHMGNVVHWLLWFT